MPSVVFGNLSGLQQAESFDFVDGFPVFGRGIDGNITLAGSTNINTSRSGAGITRTVDAPAASITAFNADNKTLSVTVRAGVIGDWKASDMVLVINQQGGAAGSGNVGNWELGQLASDGAAGTLVLVNALTKIFGATSSNLTLTNQVVTIYRLPEFNIATLNSGAVLTCSAWNGTWGGVCAFVVQSLIHNGTGKVQADGLGYRAGTVAGAAGEGQSGGFNTVQSTANGVGGGGGLQPTPAPVPAGTSGSPITNPQPASVVTGGSGGGGAGGSAGGAGGGGGYAAPGGAGGAPGSGGGSGAGAPGATPFSPTANGFNGTGNSSASGGTAAAPGSPLIGNHGNGSNSPSNSGGGAAGGVTGQAAVTQMFMGGAGGNAGAGTNGNAAGNGGNALNPFPGPALGGPSGGGGGGGGGFTAGSGGAAGTAGTPGAAGVGSVGSAGTTGGQAGGGGGIIFCAAKSATAVNFTTNGVAGATGGNGGNGGTVAGPPSSPTSVGAGSGGGGGAGGGGGGGAGGTVLLVANNLVSVATLSAAAGGAGVGGTPGAGGVNPSPTVHGGLGGTGATGGTAGAGAAGRARALYVQLGTALASNTADGTAPTFPGASPSTVTYKQSL